jgi:hypothetical protein
MGKNVDLREFMWKVMAHVGAGKLFLREDGAIVYDAPCSCGNDLCGDELVLSPNRDRLLWSRWWGDSHLYDRWVFYPDGDYDYIGTVDQEGGFRYPPVVPE